MKEIEGNIMPYIFIKFCDKIEYAKDICNGDLYSNTIDYFREVELNTGNSSQGDKNELTLNPIPSSIKILDIETDELLGQADSIANIRFDSDSKKTIVSLVGIEIKSMEKLDYAENNSYYLKLPFTDSEISKMSDSFGKYCVIIDPPELYNNLYIYSKLNGIYTCINKVNYNSNSKEHINCFFNESVNRFFYKESKFSYQREYRILFDMKLPCDHFIKIGKIANSKIFKSEDLKNLIFSKDFKIFQKNI